MIRTPSLSTFVQLAERTPMWGWVVAALMLTGLGASLAVRADGSAAGALGTAAAKPALTVSTVQPQRQALPVTVAATGNIAAWQEASVGAEVHGLRLTAVPVQVGDRVRRGQLLATFDAQTVQAELAQIEAAVAEAEALLAEAQATAARARELQATGAVSDQQINQWLTAERTAQARLAAQRASAQAQSLRLRQTRLLAPDDGVISARQATVGAVVPAGTELFRLIRQGRLEWRAEVLAEDLAALRIGQPVRVTPVGAAELTGVLRAVAPTLDASTRLALVYVDLPRPPARGDGLPSGGVRAGMFARGQFETGSRTSLTLPSSAVLLRDGFSYVFVLGEAQRVRQVKVQTARRVGERVEIVEGLSDQDRVVERGAGFLADGDTVRVVTTEAPAVPAAPAR